MAVNRAIYHHMADVTIVSNLFLIELCADELQHLELSQYYKQELGLVQTDCYRELKLKHNGHS